MLLDLATWQGGALADVPKDPSPTTTWRRPAPRKPRRYKCDARVHSPFYGYAPELIAEWCHVTLRVAQGWKAGKSKPPSSALALFQLHADGQVLPAEFKGYRFAKGKLFRNGRLGFTPAHIEAYELVFMIAMTHARSDVAAHLERMKLLQRKEPPEAAERRQPAPRWIWDPFFNPIDGARTVHAGTDHDRKA